MKSNSSLRQVFSGLFILSTLSSSLSFAHPLRAPSSNKEDDAVFSHHLSRNDNAQGILGFANVAVGVASVILWGNDFSRVGKYKEYSDEARNTLMDYRNKLAQAEGRLTVEDRFRNLQYLNAELEALKSNVIANINEENIYKLTHSPEVTSRINSIEAELSRQSILQAALTEAQADLRNASLAASEKLKLELQALQSGHHNLNSSAVKDLNVIQTTQNDLLKHQVQAIEEQIKKWNSVSVISMEEKAAEVAKAKVSMANALKHNRVAFTRYARRMGLRALEMSALGIMIIDLTGRIYIYNDLNADPTLSPTFTYLKAKLTN